MREPFDPDLFGRYLQTQWIGRAFVYREEVGSTNLALKKISSDELKPGTVLLTDYQTSGRGQYEKKWHSGRNENLTFTIAFCPAAGTGYALLTLACASAIADILQAYISEKVTIKWPNDIFVDGQKIGGILTEAVFLGNKPDRVLVGIGLNVFQRDFDLPEPTKAASLVMLCGDSISREKLLSDCLFEIEKAFHQWESCDSELLLKINQKLIGYGEWVHLSVDNELDPQKYKFIGVSQQGEMLVLNEQLDVNKFSYEQVRVIPVKQGV